MDRVASKAMQNEEMLARAGVAAAGQKGLPASAAQRVYEDLRNRIIQFDLPPQTTLSRQELADRYEVSQTPVREAILRLGEEGLVRIYPQSRTIVSRIDIGQLSEAHFLRLAVEIEVARRLAASGGAELIGEAVSIVDRQEQLAEGDLSMERFTELDEAFHQSLFTAAGQPGLFEMVKAKTGHLARLRRLDLPSTGKIAAILRDHRRILAAIAAGDEGRAVEAMRRHMTGTISAIDALVSANPDYFRT